MTTRGIWNSINLPNLFSKTPISYTYNSLCLTHFDMIFVLSYFSFGSVVHEVVWRLKIWLKINLVYRSYAIQTNTYLWNCCYTAHWNLTRNYYKKSPWTNISLLYLNHKYKFTQECISFFHNQSHAQNSTHHTNDNYHVHTRHMIHGAVLGSFVAEVALEVVFPVNKNSGNSTWNIEKTFNFYPYGCTIERQYTLYLNLLHVFKAENKFEEIIMGVLSPGCILFLARWLHHVMWTYLTWIWDE